LFQTLNRVDTIRWYILPDGSDFFPGLHLYGGRPWLKNRGATIVGPGELSDAPLVFDKGVPPNPPAVFAGQMDWFLNGVPDNLAPP
jgi:hypothetical protein